MGEILISRNLNKEKHLTEETSKEGVKVPTTKEKFRLGCRYN